MQMFTIFTREPRSAAESISDFVMLLSLCSSRVMACICSLDITRAHLSVDIKYLILFFALCPFEM